MRLKTLLLGSSMFAMLFGASPVSVQAQTPTFDRTVVIEEGTGTWCGWCVRGIVAMDYMKKTYGDKFLGIAVHANDAMQVYDYAVGTNISGFPGCNVQRKYFAQDVDQDVFVNFYNEIRATKSLGKVTMKSAVLDRRNYSISVSSESEFCYSGTGSYNVAYVLIEDGVTGFVQANYYSGGKYGEMGGFENLPAAAPVVFEDVARAIVPSYAGTTIATKVVKGQKYAFDYNFDCPADVQRYENLFVAALLFDANGEIINASKMPVTIAEDTDKENPLPDAGNFRYVDLGLSVLWSPTNLLGADYGYGQKSAKPEMAGVMAKWADLTGNGTGTNDDDYPNANPPASISGSEDYDIAHVKWGYGWRLPSDEELQELVDNCTISEQTINNKKGLVLTSKINGNTIFFPYSGYRLGLKTSEASSGGYYWSGTLNQEPVGGTIMAYALKMNVSGMEVISQRRATACSIRPVCPKPSAGVDNVAVDYAEPVSTTYYNLSGMMIPEPESGLVIEKTIYSNGKVKTSKKIIRK